MEMKRWLSRISTAQYQDQRAIATKIPHADGVRFYVSTTNELQLAQTKDYTIFEHGVTTRP